MQNGYKNVEIIKNIILKKKSLNFTLLYFTLIYSTPLFKILTFGKKVEGFLPLSTPKLQASGQAF